MEVESLKSKLDKDYNVLMASLNGELMKLQRQQQQNLTKSVSFIFTVSIDVVILYTYIS